MLDYSLAKQLKDAGFPHSRGWMVKPDASDELDEDPDEFPTLSELIEAYGKKFKALEFYPWAVRPEGRWVAKEWIIDERTNEPESKFWYFGSTPEEAVARLWLALHSHV